MVDPDELVRLVAGGGASAQGLTALAAVLEGSAEAILVCDDQGRVTFANPAASQTFGYPHGSLTGLPLGALVPELPLARPPVGRLDLTGVRKDGTPFPVEAGASVLELAQGPGRLVFVRETSERRHLEDRLAAERGQLEQLAFEATQAEERQRHELARQLHDTVGQSLALALLRLRAGPDGPTSREVAALLEKALADTRAMTFELSPPVLYDLGLPAALSWLADQLAADHQFELVVRAEGAIPRLEDDVAGVLFRSIRELTLNTLKHANVPKATVHLRAQSSHLTVAVEDHGTGVDGAQLGDGRTAGFGLLSLRGQINRLGGTFEATSSSRRGTVVTLSVPVRAQQPD